MKRGNICFTEENKNGEGKRRRYCEKENKLLGKGKYLIKGKSIWFVEKKKKQRRKMSGESKYLVHRVDKKAGKESFQRMSRKTFREGKKSGLRKRKKYFITDTEDTKNEE